MELIHGIADLERPLVRAVLTIGNFDGLHLGHRAIMETVITRARALEGESVVYTFDPHPRKILQPERAPQLLMTLAQKAEMLDSIGVDVMIVEPFDRQFADISPEDFITDYIHKRIDPQEVYVGYDFHYGHDREGSLKLLTETGPRLGFAVTIIPEVTHAGRDVNSTRIRGLLARGRVEEAAQLLGRPFSIRGVVIEGERRGRELGFPTANLDPETEVLPSPGVYAGRVRFLDDDEPARGKLHPAVTNVGFRPTFGAGKNPLAEAHLIDFQGELYGRSIELSFQHRLRAERKFPGIDALREQIARDVCDARRWLEHH